jgi:hypothetical protein
VQGRALRLKERSGEIGVTAVEGRTLVWKRLIAAFVIAVVVSLSLPVHAQLTDAELESAARLVTALDHYLGAVDGLGINLPAPESERPHVASAFRRINVAALATVRAFGLLIGAQTEPDPDTLANYTREQKVALAFASLDRATRALDEALVLVGRFPPVPDGAYGATVPNLNGWKAKVAKVDRSLPYATPLPPIPAGETTVKVVGPHGNLEKLLTAWAGQASQLWLRVSERFLEAYAAGVPDVGQMRFGLRGLAFLVKREVYASARAYGMAFSDAETNLDKFFQVLGVLHDQLKRGPSHDHGAPYIMREIALHALDAFKTATTDEQRRALFLAVVAVAQAWGEHDEGAWQAVIFPDCSIAREPAGCGGRGTQ